MRKLMGIALIAVIILLVGCSGGSSDPIDVEITVNEFNIVASQTDFKVGQTYNFIVTNEGALEHEFMIIEPMGMDSDDAMEEDDHDDAALLVITEDELQAGATVTKSYTFEEHDADHELEFACHIAGHYEGGMHVPITVEK